MDTTNGELVQTWLKDLDPKSNQWYRLNAVRKLGALKFSDPQVIEALMLVKERDRDSEVRAAAENALLTLANRPGTEAQTPGDVKALAELNNFNLTFRIKPATTCFGNRSSYSWPSTALFLH